MSNNFVLVVYLIAVGFSLSGCAAMLYQCITKEAASFAVKDGGLGSAVITMSLWALGGPFIIMRNLLEDCRQKRSSLYGSFFISLLVGSWSMISGMFFINAAILMGAI